MLVLTHTASTVIENIVARAADPSTAGLRIHTGQEATQFEVAVAPAPHPGDSVVEAGGARVFLESSAADALAAKVLDASVGDQGAVTFALAEQPV